MNTPSFKYPDYIAGFSVLALFLLGCAGGAPLDEIERSLENVPTWTVILDDMKEEGNFFQTYHHKYRIVEPESAETTNWAEVPKDTYMAYRDYLGMTILSKEDGKVDTHISPPHYRYVGDTRYGSWQNDLQGNSFWVFYGQYSLLRDLMGGRRVYRHDYEYYTKKRKKREPWFGRDNAYGTAGTYTKKTKPNFYARKKKMESAKKSTFKDRVGKRIGRTRSLFRSRSGGRGK